MPSSDGSPERPAESYVVRITGNNPDAVSRLRSDLGEILADAPSAAKEAEMQAMADAITGTPMPEPHRHRHAVRTERVAGAVSNDWLGREALEDLLIGTFGMPDDTVKLALDGYAHELAEKIRASHGNPPEHSSKQSKYTYDWHARRNADLIDPEKP